RRHVFGDLKPYVCIEPDCKTAKTHYTTRQEWVNHVESQHWRSWFCPFECNETLLSVRMLKEHIDNAHDTLRSESYEVEKALRGIPHASETVSICLLCQEQLSGLRDYTRHIGRHHEEVALLALRHHKDNYGVENSDKEVSSSSKRSQQDEYSGWDQNVSMHIEWCL
ncbi:uncharacterized protein PODANS_5_440, partial [Podospora anserina S mat+]